VNLAGKTNQRLRIAARDLQSPLHPGKRFLHIFSGGFMKPGWTGSHLILTAALLSAFLIPASAGDEAPLDGYSPASSKAQREWESKFRALPDPKVLRDTMQRLSARPHHVGTPYDKDNAEWILARFKE
jgi:hypothetical protein